MSFVSVGVGVAGLGLSAYKMAKESHNAKAAAKALENYQRQEVTNKAEGLQVSTMGADLQKEQLARANESYIQSLREGGTRALLGGIGAVQTKTQDVNKEIAANLDQQQKQIDIYKMQEEQNMRGIKEQREQNDINALSSQYNAAKEASSQALSSGLQSLSMVGNALSKKFDNNKDDTKDSTSGEGGLYK
jgi:hypothetical protein